MYEGSQMLHNVKATLNVFHGACEMKCRYCIIHRNKNPKKKVVFSHSRLSTSLDFTDIKVKNKKEMIFVGNSTDMFAPSIDVKKIQKVINMCNRYHEAFIFLTKNPEKYHSVNFNFAKMILGVTIETNRYYPEIMCKAPTPKSRTEYMALDHDPFFHKKDRLMKKGINRRTEPRKVIVIEPVMDFDTEPFIDMIKDINPVYIYIGANTASDVQLPEPSPEKLKDFILKLKDSGFKVHKKSNLERLL